MSIFKQVDFSKIYAGNLPSGQHYCNWFAQYENEDATESINNNAFGLYSADAFSQCQQQNAISGNLSRYDESQAQILDFKRIKRNSNFLIPVILGYSDDRIVNISISNSTESDNNKLYMIGIEEGNGKMLSSYNLNHEITQSFLLDSFIITKIEDSSISTFSIFNDTTSLITYFISNEDDSAKVLSLLVQPQQDGTPIEKKYNWNDLKSSSYTFYKYSIPFNSMGSGELNSIRLKEFHPNTLQEFIDEVKTGTIYISKNDLGYTLLTNSIIHPNYILSKIKFNYFNPLRDAIIDSFTFQVVGNTNNCINPFKFLRKNNNDITPVLKYQLNTEEMRLNTILDDGMNGDFISVESNTSPYYYAGGILFGWTTNKSNCFNIAENKIILQQEEPAENATLFKARNNINDSLKNFYTQFYVSENEDNSYFYFSNNRDKTDLSTIDSAFMSKEINLYPIYLDDPNYITPVVEITNQSEDNPSNDNFIALTESGLKQLINNTKKYSVVDIETVKADQWETASDGQPSIKVVHGNEEYSYAKTSDTNIILDKKYFIYNDQNGYELVASPDVNDLNSYYELVNYKYVKVGSNITFADSQSINADYIEKSDEEESSDEFNYYYINNGEYVLLDPEESFEGKGTIYKKLKQQPGTFRVNVNTDTYEVGIKGFANNSIGTENNPWDNAYITTGRFDTINIWDGKNTTPKNYTDLSEYINDAVTYDQNHPLKITNETDGIKQGNSNEATNGFNPTYTGTYYGDTRASINTSGGIYAAKNIWATRVFNAVFNDYAECRSTISLTPGHVVIDQDDGSLACSSKRLQSGAQVISDTYGHLMGQTEKATTPIAVAGRVLVYTYQSRENYHAGMAVCSAPDGTVDIMTREEIRDYPDCIIGIVSEIPQYETWGSDNVKVDGRIWIKVK